MRKGTICVVVVVVVALFEHWKLAKQNKLIALKWDIEQGKLI